MTTNKPGSVNQQPLYGCTSCYEHCTWPAGDLRVYDNECWCDLCWDERRWDFPGQPCWNDLESYTPALQAELERERQRRFDGNEQSSREHREEIVVLVEALERAVRRLESAGLFSSEAAIRGRATLAAHRKGGNV